MKKTMVVILILVVVIASAFARQYSNEREYETYAGIMYEHSQVAGLKNARLSDVKWYPTQEGSLLLPLEDANGNGNLFGIVFGGRTFLMPNLNALAEVGISFGGTKTFAINLNVGSIFYFVDSNVHVGAGVKVGFYDYNKYLGEAEILLGTTPPVILPEGTIRNGDLLSYSIMGFNINPIVDMYFDLSDLLAFGVSIGYQFCITAKSELQATPSDSNKGVSIDPKTSDAYYEPTAAGFTPLEMNPTATLNGVTAQIYGLYRF